MDRVQLDIRELLKGTRLEKKADFLANKLAAAKMDNLPDIQNLPMLGSKVAGEAPQDIIRIVLEQYEQKASEPEPEEEEQSDEVNASAAALELAARHEVDLSTVTGTGSGGKIVKADIEELIA